MTQTPTTLTREQVANLQALFRQHTEAEMAEIAASDHEAAAKDEAITVGIVKAAALIGGMDEAEAYDLMMAGLE